MKNVSRKKGWGMDTNPSHVEPPRIPLIKETPTGKSDVDYVKLELCIDPTSSTLDLYEFRVSLFYHVETEEFILFVWDFQMTLLSMGTLDAEAKVSCITIFCGEVLRQFDSPSSGVENTDTSLNVDYIFKGLARYFFL